MNKPLFLVSSLELFSYCLLVLYNSDAYVVLSYYVILLFKKHLKTLFLGNRALPQIVTQEALDDSLSFKCMCVTNSLTLWFPWPFFLLERESSTLSPET